MENLHLDCDCHSAEHILRFMPAFPHDRQGPMIDIQLNQYQSFWKRLKVSIKYLFTKDGSNTWDTFVMKPTDIPVLIKFLEQQHEFLEESKNEKED